jgi:hypothetical protein
MLVRSALTFAFFTALSTPSFAAPLHCSAHDGGYSIEVEINPDVPTFETISWRKERNEVKEERRVYLTATTVSSRAIERSACSLKSESAGMSMDMGMDMGANKFNFSCQGYRRGGANNEVKASFAYDPAQRSGFYEETLASFIPPKYIEFSDCH